MRTLLISTLAAMAMLLTTAQAADIEAGKAKAVMLQAVMVGRASVQLQYGLILLASKSNT